MKNKKVISEIDRVREIMGVDLLNEQNTPCSCTAMIGTYPCGHYPNHWASALGAFDGEIEYQINLSSGCNYPLTVTQKDSSGSVVYTVTFNTWHGAGGTMGGYNIPGASNLEGGATYTLEISEPSGCIIGTNTPPAPYGDGSSSEVCYSTNYECTTNGCVADPNGQYTTEQACQQNCSNFGAGWFCLPPGGGGQGSCQYTPSMTIGPNGPFATESACETSNYCGGITSVDCTQYGVDYDPVTLDNSAGGWFLQGLNLATNGNCQGIQNKIQQVNNIPNQEKRDCRLDYLNLLLALCQSNAGSCTAWTAANGDWIGEMEDRYNGLGAPQHTGCWGPNGNNTNSVCGRKAHFCPGSTPSKECKCDWLTTFTAIQNCGC